jgi:hypothetical protein
MLLLFKDVPLFLESTAGHDLVWSRHQLEELAERQFRAAQV